MPIYEYECDRCEKVFEVQQRISEDPLKTCPECGAAVKKLVSMSAFHLKGGGWYADGYAGASNGNGKNGDAGKKEDAQKSEKATSPPCQSGTAPCKNCPASA